MITIVANAEKILIVKTKNVAFPPKFFSLLYAMNKPFNVNTTSEKIMFNLFPIHFLCAEEEKLCNDDHFI